MEDPERPKDKFRPSDIYVFALLDHKDQESIDLMNLTQWSFFIITSKRLDIERGMQKRISLESLVRLKPKTCYYHDLSKTLIGISKEQVF